MKTKHNSGQFYLLYVAHQVAPLEINDAAPDTQVKEDAVASSPGHIDNLTSLSSDLEKQDASDAHASKSLLESDQFSDSFTHLDSSSKSISVLASQEQQELSHDDETYVPKKILTQGG